MSDQHKISEAILHMATERGADKTICPSEVARALFPSNWRKYMGEIRSAAVKLQLGGKVMITQKGQLIDTDQIKGPIRIKIVKL